MHVTECDTKDQIFSFIMGDTKEQIHINVTKLQVVVEEEIRTYRPNAETRLIGLSHEQVSHIVMHNGIEFARVRRLTPEQRDMPILVCHTPGPDDTPDNPTCIIADGNHRVLNRWLRGYNTVEAYFVREPLWRRFLITGIPDFKDAADLHSRPSGL